MPQIRRKPEKIHKKWESGRAAGRSGAGRRQPGKKSQSGIAEDPGFCKK
jgi:hypothetical protein